jgi:8-oxo-dGTP pyrophosphatase MutT (NUDIX family)
MHTLQNDGRTHEVPRPAATVMLVRDARPRGVEVFVVRRSARSAFMPDAYVFPGGALDAADASPEAVARLDAIPAGVSAAFAVAAIRELFEEAGVLLARRKDGANVAPDAVAAVRTRLEAVGFGGVVDAIDATLRGSALTYYSHWITPPVETTRRFDTRFFVARAPADQVAAADTVETHDGLWTTPGAALACAERGEIVLVFPTRKHLERLSVFASVDELEAHARARRPQAVMPDVAADGTITLPAGLQSW